MMKYYSVVNKTGLAKLASVMALNQPLNLTSMAIGDGGGKDNIITPSDTKNTLVREVYRAPIVSLHVEDPERPGLMTATMIVPPDKGGWAITEGLLLCDDGTPFANASLTPGHKSTLAEGGVGEYIVEFVFEVSNAEAAAVQLIINPYITIATRQWVTAAYATKAEVAAAIAAVESKLSKPPILETPGDMPVSGNPFIQAPGNYQLLKSPEGSLLEIVVSPAIEPPHLMAPAGEKVKSIKGDHDSIRLVTYGQPYRFLRKDNAWRQL